MGRRHLLREVAEGTGNAKRRFGVVNVMTESEGDPMGVRSFSSWVSRQQQRDLASGAALLAGLFIVAVILLVHALS